jgi:O-antigen ligase
MSTEKVWTRLAIDPPTLWFLIGLAVVMLALWFPFIPGWTTFIHMWRGEIASSVLLLSTLVYFYVRQGRTPFRLQLHRDELRFVVVPIILFISWSLLSAIWAPSWRSTLHHSFVWAEYLMFYVIFRRMIDDNRSIKHLLTVLVLTLVLYSVPAIVEYCAYLWIGGKTTIGMRYAKFGEQVVTLLPLLLLGVIRTRGKRFVLGASAVVLLWLLIFCTLGRANYLLFGLVVIALFAMVCISLPYRQYAPRFAILTAILLAAPIPLHVFSLASSEPAVPALARARDTAGLENSNNFRKMMISVSGEMIRANPLIGVGADNYGTQVNNYRQIYGSRNPNDVNLANAEDRIPSHAHNEFLQIAAELGVVGFLIFSGLLVGIAVLAFRALRQVRSGSLYPAAAVLGLVMFLASSLVSSYSFRVMQNGIVFFFVLAVASSSLFRGRESAATERWVSLSTPQLKFAAALSVVACVGLMTYSLVRLSSVIVTAKANQTRSLDDAVPMYEMAMRLDTENPDARHNLGMRLLRRKRFAAAVPHLASAIQLGRSPSSEMSYLATVQSLSHDPAGAEATMKAAAELYPRSPFVLTRYSTLLEDHGKHAEAAEYFNRAVEINERAAITWRAVINSGPKAVSEMAARDTAFMQVMELSPEGSIYAVVTERFIKNPAEQRFSGFRAVQNDE